HGHCAGLCSVVRPGRGHRQPERSHLPALTNFQTVECWPSKWGDGRIPSPISIKLLNSLLSNTEFNFTRVNFNGASRTGEYFNSVNGWRAPGKIPSAPRSR